MRATAQQRHDGSPIRVLVVDDSGVARMAMSRVLRAGDLFEVVAAVGDGREAVDVVEREATRGYPIEIVLLDVEMPTLGGLEALPQLLAVSPAPRVIMASSHTRRGAATTLRALTLGASDYICKPDAGAAQSADDFASELVAKVQVWAAAFRRQNSTRPPRSVSQVSGAATAPGIATPNGRSAVSQTSALSRRSFEQAKTGAVRVVAIGASTGGPQALSTVLAELRRVKGPPLLITQHMPASFTPILAEHLARVLEMPCAEGIDGEPVLDGRAFVAPGGRHMLVRSDPRGGKHIRLTDDPPENFCRPAVDPMLRSVAECYGNGSLAVILTGMGQDGLSGCESVARCGGRVLAQDEASSVVWGMPGAVARRGLADEILPLAAIGPRILRLFEGVQT